MAIAAILTARRATCVVHFLLLYSALARFDIPTMRFVLFCLIISLFPIGCTPLDMPSKSSSPPAIGYDVARQRGFGHFLRSTA